MLWIDVRSATEYQSGHFPEAVNVEHTEIAAGIGQFAMTKDQPIKLYCGTGHRAGIAKQALEEMGYSNVSNEGGLKDVLVKYPDQ